MNETIEDIVKRIRDENPPEYYMTYYCAGVKPNKMRKLADRIEAVARRAYNEIYSAVCSIEEAASCEIDDVRKAIEKTLGDYYE